MTIKKEKERKKVNQYITLYLKYIWFIRFRVALVRTTKPNGILRYSLHKNILCKTRQEACELLNTRCSADVTFCTI